jgi:hypothetical protein
LFLYLSGNYINIKKTIQEVKGGFTYLYFHSENERYIQTGSLSRVPNIARQNIQVSFNIRSTGLWSNTCKPTFHFLFQELFALIYWRIKYFKLKYGLSLLKIHEKYKKYIFRIIFYVSLMKNDKQTIGFLVFI